MKRWFPRGHFSPSDILYDPAYQDLSKSGKKIYLLLCRRSYLVKHSPTRRYSVWTYNQIAFQVGLSRRQVARIMKQLMEGKLIYRWYAGDSGSSTATGRARPPRYEIPASRGMINWWRRTRTLVRKIFQDRKEVITHGRDNRSDRSKHDTIRFVCDPRAGDH